MKMYEPPIFDILVDFNVKDEEEIICRGRGRHTERRVPRLPHAAYIIKKQNELYHGGQCTYPCFPGVSFTSTLHNILSKPLTAFPHNHRQNNGKLSGMEEYLNKINPVPNGPVKALDNIVRKGENAGHQHFLFIPQLVLPFLKQLLSFNPLPNNKILDWTKLKAFAEDKDRDIMNGRKKHGRGRARMLNPKTLNPEAFEFIPRTSNYKMSNHKPRPFTAHLDMNENVHSSHSDGEVIGCSFQQADSVSHAGRPLHAKHHSADPLVPSSDRYTGDMATSAVQSAKAQREKEKYNHKVNFAEINRQMLQELAGQIHNNVTFKKPVRVMSLTKVNLDRHVRDTEVVFKQSETMFTSNTDSGFDDDIPIYEKYGVTHEDIWLYKQNRFKMPQAVKKKVNEFNKAGQMVDCVNGHVVDEQTRLESVKCETDGEKTPNIESEHEKQVIYLKLLYDEDSWSNQKELSVSSTDEEKVAGDCQVPNVKSENNIESIDQQISVSVECTDKDDLQNNPVDGSIENSVAKMEIKGSDASEQANISEQNQDAEHHEQTNDATIDSVNFDRLSINGNTCSVSDPTESDERSLSIVDEVNTTIKEEEKGVSEKQETFKNNSENTPVSTDNFEMQETYKNNSENIQGSTDNCVDILTIKKEEVQDKADSRTSDISDTVDEVIDEPAEGTDLEQENLENIVSKGDTETILCSVSTNCDDHSEPLVTEENDEKLPQGKAQVVDTKVVRSTIAQLDDFSIPGDKETKIDTIVNGVEDVSEANVDDMEGFQVVKKKRSKKKSVSPPVKQRRNKVKPDNTVWKLYGKNVIQVDGLPLDCDISNLCSVVSSFGTIQDYQQRVIDTNCSIRFRLADEDSCNYAVMCLDNTEIFHDENCIVSCFKLSY